MNHLIVYLDENKNIINEIHDSAAISLSIIHANLMAYRNNRQVLNVKMFYAKDIILKAIKEDKIDTVINTIIAYNEDNKYILNKVADLAVSEGIEFEQEEYENNVTQILILDGYIINLYGCYNAYGIIDLKSIDIFECNKIIMDKEIDNGEKRAV